MKKVLGLDLGSTSIGWAVVEQAERESEKSSIVGAGVRVNPLTSDEKNNFEKGKAVTTNADRTLKRGMRRSLQRYKLRRQHLMEILRREGWIDESSLLSEDGANTTYETLMLRSQAAESEITLAQFARVLLSINKKRGYKSNRKALDDEADGALIDGMEIARTLYEKGMTPSQYSLNLMKSGIKAIPDFYRSDLEKEFEAIWNVQSAFYPEILTSEFKRQIMNQGRVTIGKIFLAKYGIYTADNKGKDRKMTALEWRCDALRNKLQQDVMAYVIADVREEIKSSSGYLGAISDRSKELYFNKQTVGQYLYSHLVSDPLFSTRNKVFYRQDYLDEFETIWECQRRFHKGLDEALKNEIRDVVIFYQRPLKSQKGLISFCEFESRPVKVLVDGKEKVKLHGCKVAPRSSLMFQEFKIWQILNNIQIHDSMTGERYGLSVGQMCDLSKELTSKAKLSATEALRFLGYRSRRYEMNYKSLEGNSTMAAIYEKCLKIVDMTGHGEYNASKVSFEQADSTIREVFSALGFSTEFLDFDSTLPKKEYENQKSVRLWHLLYSYEGDNSTTGDAGLVGKVSEICNMPREYAKVLCGLKFLDDYASLSHKAISKILPHLKGGNTYDVACQYAGYNHSHSRTAEEIENKALKDHLDQLPKGALRNPVVEKIINQMVNVVNSTSQMYGRPDEIHIELARELKQNQLERQRATADIAARTKENEEITKILKDEFHLLSVTQNDILRYRLYEELKFNGYKTLYSDKYVPRDILFGKDMDIEHIIPQARMFNDSFSNKTLEYRDVNLAKGKETANDYVKSLGDERYADYVAKVENLCHEGRISKSKRNFLMMSSADIPSDFLNRDLSNSQYIAKKAKEMLEEYVKTVVTTTGSVTKRLREDWQLVEVMRELNLPKYKAAGLTYEEINKEGQRVTKINDWSKRNDHRHHAMDAITIAFTRNQHIQLLNNLNASSEKDSIFHAMKCREMTGGTFNPPMPLGELRASVKTVLEATLVSIKAKNKVVTHNVNKTASKEGERVQHALTPRGSLHMEQVYGKRMIYETFFVAVGSKMTYDVIDTVASARERDALRARLDQFGGNPKNAFGGANALEKSPIYLDDFQRACVPAKVKCVRFVTRYRIRKEIGPGFKIDKVADPHVRQILQARLDLFDGNSAKAFSDLENNPIWLNEEKQIRIRRVAIFENFNLVALHDKRDKDGNLIKDSDGNTIPTDYVNLRNNHHIAIYRDEKGKLQEKVVPFFEALQRISSGLKPVDKDYRSGDGWQFLFSMKINEMFVFPNPATGFDPNEVDLTDMGNYCRISPNLFRVQKLSDGDYYFRHHCETTLDNVTALRNITWMRLGLSALEGAVKVRVNHIGQIVSVGEYD